MKKLGHFVAGLLWLVATPASAQQNVQVIGPVTPGDLPVFNSPTIIKDSGTPVGNFLVNPFSEFDPTLGAPSVSTGISWTVNTDFANVSPGFSGSFAGAAITSDVFHGDHSSAAKSTMWNWLMTMNAVAAGQTFNVGAIINKNGGGDYQSYSVNLYNFSGLTVGGDEGACLFCGFVQDGAAGAASAYSNPTTTISGTPTTGGGSTTTTQTITGSLSPQTVTVSSSSGFAVNEWVEINNTSNHSSAGKSEAVLLTGVSAGSITGIFRLSQSSGVNVTPATVLPVASTVNIGEHRILVDTTLACYSTGTIAYDDVTGHWNGSGTSWTNNIVGGNSTVIGAIAATADTPTGGGRSWFPISAVNSTTQLVTNPSRFADLPGSSAAYTICPAVYVLRVLPTNNVLGGPGNIVVETNVFAFANGDTIETGIGPVLSGVGGHYSGYHWQPNVNFFPMWLDEYGTWIPQKWLNMSVENASAACPQTSGANQCAFIFADSGPAPGAVNTVLIGKKTNQLLNASIANGGSYVCDQYGCYLNGLLENAPLSATGRGLGAAFENDNTWNNSSQHIAFGANITDTLSTVGSDFIKMCVISGSCFEVRKDGTVLQGTWNGTVIGQNFGGTGSATASANLVFAGPNTGAPAQPSFRALVGSDLPFPGTGVANLGGVQTKGVVSHNFLTGISSVDGSVSAAQPACGDLSNSGTACQANTGTSGGNVPLLNGNNTESGNNIHTGTETFQSQIIPAYGTPTIASGACGATTNGTLAGGSTNQSGEVIIASATTTTCTISFSTTLAAAPLACVLEPGNAQAATELANSYISAITTAHWVITGTALASTDYYYHCF